MRAITLALGVVIGAAGAAGGKPLEFATATEARYFDLLLACEGQLDAANRRLEGERTKTATVVTICAATCPAIPPCPSCPDPTGPAWVYVATHLGAAAGGAALGRLSCGDPGVTVVR